MNNEQKYSELLKEIGALLADKNTTISCQRYQINELEQRLKMAEAERDEANACAKRLDEKLAVALVEIEQLKGGAA